MRSGFADLRNEFSMDLRLRDAHPIAAWQDIARIVRSGAKQQPRFGRGGDYLCGPFGVVDAFWCPVAFRFRSYGVVPEGASAMYLRALLALPAMVEWAAGAANEREVIAADQAAQAQQQ
jgi:glutathione S-transferase